MIKTIFIYLILLIRLIQTAYRKLNQATKEWLIPAKKGKKDIMKDMIWDFLKGISNTVNVCTCTWRLQHILFLTSNRDKVYVMMFIFSLHQTIFIFVAYVSF